MKKFVFSLIISFFLLFLGFHFFVGFHTLAEEYDTFDDRPVVDDPFEIGDWESTEDTADEITDPFDIYTPDPDGYYEDEELEEYYEWEDNNNNQSIVISPISSEIPKTNISTTGTLWIALLLVVVGFIVYKIEGTQYAFSTKLYPYLNPVLSLFSEKHKKEGLKLEREEFEKKVGEE